MPSKMRSMPALPPLPADPALPAHASVRRQTTRDRILRMR